MIRTMLKFEVDPSLSDTVIERYKEIRILEMSIELSGALSCEILQDIDSPGSLIVLALWESREAYAGWQNHPERAGIGSKLADLGLELTGSIYEIRTLVTPDSILL